MIQLVLSTGKKLKLTPVEWREVQGYAHPAAPLPLPEPEPQPLPGPDLSKVQNGKTANRR